MGLREQGTGKVMVNSQGFPSKVLTGDNLKDRCSVPSKIRPHYEGFKHHPKSPIILENIGDEL